MRRRIEICGGVALVILAIVAGGWWKKARRADGNPPSVRASHEQPKSSQVARLTGSASPTSTGENGGPPQKQEQLPEEDKESVFKGQGTAPPPKYYPRDPAEWQGRLVEVSVREPCNDFGSCGRGRACRADSTCGPCLNDGDCNDKEVCVLNNCVLEDKVLCRSQRDCPGEDSLCILDDDGSAYGWRGNEALYAVCSGSEEERRIAAATEDSDDRDGPRGPKPIVPPEPISLESLAEELSGLTGTPVQLEKGVAETMPD